MIPVSDYLHLWKNCLNKIKNHPVTMSPDSFEAVLEAENLESILQLGPALLNKSSVGRMRDSYALQLFSYANCLKCLESYSMNEVMYFMSWAIQEEVVRNPALSRDERLMKAILSFKLLLHYFDLSCLPCQDGIPQRYTAGQTEAVTFASDAPSRRIRNCALVLIQFVFTAEEHCSFSRVGTHCLENFFGLIGRNSFGDDRLIRAIRLIARGTAVADVMYELSLNVKHQRRDNVGGVVISGNPPEFTDTESEKIFQLVIHISSLEYYDSDPGILLSLHEIKGILRG